MERFSGCFHFVSLVSKPRRLLQVEISNRQLWKLLVVHLFDFCFDYRDDWCVRVPSSAVGFGRGPRSDRRESKFYFNFYLISYFCDFKRIIKFQLKSIDYPVNYIKLVRRNAKIAVALISLIVPLIIMMYFLEGSALKVPLYIYSNLYLTLSMGSVTVYVTAVFLRLCSVSEVLSLKLKKESKRNFIQVASIDKRDDLEVIRTLSDIYGDLMDVCDETSVCFGFQLMISFGLIFFYTLFTSFTAFTDYLQEGFLIPVTISSIAFCIYDNFFLTVVIFICSLVEKEVKLSQLVCTSDLNDLLQQAMKIARLLNILVKQATDPLEISMLISFSWMVKRRRPKITCGLFDFDWGLVYSIIASASTNFIILMQFDLASRRN